MMGGRVMNPIWKRTAVAIAVSLGAVHLYAALNPANIEKLTGLKGTLNEKENVFKVSLPRSDIKASVNGVSLTPPLGLTAWAAFTPMGDHTMMMGDMVMLEPQINTVMDV